MRPLYSAAALDLFASSTALTINPDPNINTPRQADPVNCTIFQSEDYTDYANETHPPLSTGRYRLAYQRPPPECRLWSSDAVEQTIKDMEEAIADPDLYRLFENSYPSTLDTTVKWTGMAEGSDEELSFVITGDIAIIATQCGSVTLPASCIRIFDSSKGESASLFRGLINLQARDILMFPYCNAFQPPPESGLKPVNNSDAFANTEVFPQDDPDTVFECKYELDSVASFFEVSSDYYHATQDVEFFRKYQWLEAVQTLSQLISDQTYPTYTANGSVFQPPYTFRATTDRATETLSNNAYGNPARGGTGLVRSTFRPSDDACIYNLFVPANMMLASYTEKIIPILEALGDQEELVSTLSERAALIREGITKYAVLDGAFAFEIDGFGSFNTMDDAGVPSLLSAPYLGYLDRDDETYQATRKKVLDRDTNPYYMVGPEISAIGSPHIGPGWSWPMAVITQILTSDDDDEIIDSLSMLLSSTNGLGLIHESIFAFDQEAFTRPCFAWVNGYFGEMILDLYDRKPEILQRSFQ